MLLNDHPANNIETIAGVYRVEAELGRGGMARVFRVVHERTGQRFALKRLVAEGDRSATLRAMFEREYYTLVELAHPHIVRVFDYGLDGETPYYTMELLEGFDSRRSDALDVQQICLLLRDCASALALIHSRRMVHRDVSPRNLWRAPDGRAKLIDFGTLVAMGPQTRIAGTPPFVPPEAVYMQPLDGRCDLYALGALAYFLLTERNAYPARELGQLSELWQRRPTRPDAIRPEIPAALSELVMAMLSLDPRGRPVSAAEVFDRLTAIGNLPAEDERHIAQAFLISPKLVGRKVESERLRKRLERALNRRGNAVSIVSAAGIGRSRMLSSIILEGKLLGAITLAVDATAVGSGPLALVGALAEQLLELQPLAAESHAELAPLLGHLSPALRTALGKPALAEVSGASRTRKLTRALVSLFEVASRERRLVIAVDDVHRADNASLGVLAELSLLARERRMFLVTSCEVGTLANPPPALAQLVQARERIDLSPLTAADTRELLVSLFGEIHGLEDAASWLHELSQGSPQTCMHYAQYLVDQGVARYEGGHWHLDGQLRDRGLPTSLGAMFESRIAALSEDAKTIALGLVLSRDETRSSWQPELHLRFEDFAKLLDRPEPALAFAAIDELVRAGIVQQRDRYYVLGQRAIVDALLRITDPESRRRLHIRLADILGQSGYPMQILPVVQLQHAGEHARARRALTEFYRSEVSGTFDWSVMRVSVSAGCSELALAHWRLDRDGPIDAIALRKVLTLIASVYDWRLARYGDAQLDQLRHDSGLIHWDETDASQAPIQRVFECMKCAQQTYEQTPESMRGLVPASAIREIAACAMPLASAYVHSHDIERAQALPPLLAPLRALSPLIDLLAHIIDIGVARLSGKEIGDSLLVSIEKLMAATDLPQVLREGGAGVNLHAQAVEDARCGRPRALVLLERLVPGVGENMFLVFHARWLAHAFAGRAVEARRFHKQVEMITEDDVWRRNASLFVEAELHALTGDLLNLKRSRDSLAALAKTFPGIEPWAAFAQGALLRLRGESESALAEFARALASAKPGEHRAYLQAAPAHAEQRLERGQLAMALEEAIALVATVDRLGLCRSAAISGERIRALAESALGDHEAAEGSLARAFAIASEYSYGGLPLAKLYQASTQLALAAGDAGRALEALRGMWALIEHADAPAFINRYQALREESSRHLDVLDLPAQIESVRSMLTESATSWNDLNTRLSATGTPRSRAQQALSVLLDESGARAGQLFLLDQAGLYRAAAIDQEDTNDEFLSAAQRYLDSRIGPVETVTESDADGSAGLLQIGSRAVAPVLLADQEAAGARVVGVALIAADGGRPRAPRNEVIGAISRVLNAAGDSVSLVSHG